MDRRQQKTRNAIFNALNNLLQNKSFHQISVQEIIDAANIGRSTFYTHFETKDMLLNEMCNEIFEHVFQDLLPQEHQLDYAHGLANLEIKLSHILFHLNDHHHHVKGFILSDSNDLFFH